VTLRQKKPDTRWVHDTLLHRETLLVVSTGDLEDVTFELLSDAVARDFGAHTFVHEDPEAAVIVYLDYLLAAIGRLIEILESQISGKEPM
jgi:hypothetical protein